MSPVDQFNPTSTDREPGENLHFTFEKADFPEQPEWGLTKENLTGHPGEEYRKDGRRINTARVLEGLKESTLPIDQQLAIAATVSSLDIPDAKHAHFLRTLDINPLTGEVRVTYNRNPMTGKDESYGETFSPEDVARHHIPTLTGHRDPRVYAENMERNPQETLAHMVATFQKKSPSATIGLTGWYVNRAGFPMYERLAGIGNGDRFYATFPIDQLALTVGERETLNIAHQLTTEAQQIKPFDAPLLRLVQKLENKEQERGKVAKAVHGIVNRIQRKLTLEEVRSVWYAISSYPFRLRRLEEQGASILLDERNRGNTLREIPKEIAEEAQQLRDTAHALATQAENIMERAVMEGLADAA